MAIPQILSVVRAVSFKFKQVGVYTIKSEGKNMINSPIHVLDNTGCYFYSENDYFVAEYALSGYFGLYKNYAGQYISYLCKSRNGYEIGLGQIDTINDKVVINRVKVLSSSNNNNPVNFTADSSNALYSFANSYNFRTGFNNLIEKNSNFIVDNIQSSYLIDINENDVVATLPEAKNNQSLIIEFKTNNGNKKLYIHCNSHATISSLNSNEYTKFISTGKEWVELYRTGSSQVSTQSDTTFDALATLASPSGSIQYNNGDNNDLAGSNIYYNPITKKLLLGSSDENNALSIIPSSGSSPVIFNNTNNGADFIVKGSGDKNLYFGYEGRLGINIPLGARPQTSLHILNNSCQQSMRIENRNQCYPSNLTLYHKPSTAINNNDIIGTVSLSAKNSANSETEYVQLRSRALSYNSVFTSGEFAIAVNKNNTLIESLITNTNYTLITSSNNSLRISSSGSYFTGTVSLSGLKWSAPTTSGLFLTTDNNGNLVLTPPSNTNIIDLLDGVIVSFTGVCS